MKVLDERVGITACHGLRARIRPSFPMSTDGNTSTQTMASFLESCAPGSRNTFKPAFSGSNAVDLPAIRLLCSSDECDGLRVFRAEQGILGAGGDSSWVRLVLSYRCRSCEKEQKLYFLLSQPNYVANDKPIEILKIAEWPAFGSWVPSRVLKIAGPDRDLFLKGKRAEGQGLGIGAFGYYRRVVERQKGRIIEQIKKVAMRTGAPPEVIDRLGAAGKETQFTKAIELVKNAIPEQLRLKGHNPLTLLHDALSKGLHNESDEDCLQIAHDIRIMLTELVNRIEQALSDQSELDTALNRLVNSSNPT
jgi:hypothetical protein